MPFKFYVTTLPIIAFISYAMIIFSIFHLVDEILLNFTQVTSNRIETKTYTLTHMFTYARAPLVRPHARTHARTTLTWISSVESFCIPGDKINFMN